MTSSKSELVSAQVNRGCRSRRVTMCFLICDHEVPTGTRYVAMSCKAWSGRVIRLAEVAVAMVMAGWARAEDVTVSRGAVKPEGHTDQAESDPNVQIVSIASLLPVATLSPLGTVRPSCQLVSRRGEVRERGGIQLPGWSSSRGGCAGRRRTRRCSSSFCYAVAGLNLSEMRKEKEQRARRLG